MKKTNRIFKTSIFLQAVLIVFGTVLVFLALSLYIFRKNMTEVLMIEAENKATIFLSAMETSIRRLVIGKESSRLSELLDKKANFLKGNLNFIIVRAVVLDPQGYIIDHTKPDKIGQRHSSEDFEKVIASGRPMVTREIKVLKQEPGKPEILVMKVIHPVRNRKGVIVAVIKVDLDIRRTFAMIKKEYWRLNRRVVLGFALAAVLLVVSTLFFLKRRIIGPVTAVAEASTRVASGDIEPLPVQKGTDEISKLIQSFNQMVEGLKQRDQMRHALNLAREVQQNLLPKKDPIIKGLDIAGKSIYCESTGGDYYDYLYQSDHTADKICIVVGDVSDHGIQSALLMATARAFLRLRSSMHGRLKDIFRDINREFTHDVDNSGQFMTLFLTRIDRNKNSMEWVTAGHDPAIIYDPATDAFIDLKGKGLALGVMEDTNYEEHSQGIKPGQIICIGTDGIWEAHNSRGEPFGKERLKATIRKYASTSAETIVQSIIDAVEAFCENAEQEDDITLVIVKVTEI